MPVFSRKLNLKLPEKKSAFLWGARQTGKSFYLQKHFPKAKFYDLLDTHEVIRLTKAPFLLREDILALKAVGQVPLVIIDEVQKVPALLNEVQWLIENAGVQFILCGSSARKLKTQSTNLLGGRAWKYHFYPLSASEVPQFDLLRALQHGLIPNHYLADKAHIAYDLQAYIDVYLIDEIRNEGLVRNLPAFARFLDLVGLANGEMINMNNIARDCGVERTTIQGYFQILIDTLLGYWVYPYHKKVKRDLIMATPRFYLFDVGVANALAQQGVLSLRGSVAGRRFEHFILMELKAYLGLNRRREKLSYWRTKTGLEVDFIIGEAQIALEVKISTQVHQEDLKGLIAFCEEHTQATAIVISQDKRTRLLKISDKIQITIMPWKSFLQKLWRNEVF